MKQAWKAIVFVVAIVWAVISFIGANSPADVEQRARSWASLPILKSLPTGLLEMIASPIGLAFGFFVLGSLSGGVFVRWRGRRHKLSAVEVLATDVSLIAYALDNVSGLYPNHAVLGRLNVVLNKLRAQGFEMPPSNGGIVDQERMSHYLHQIAAYLNDGQLLAARQIAKTIVGQWPVPDQESAFLGPSF